MDSTEYFSLLKDIADAKHILAMVFIFDANTGEFIRSYDGLVLCAKTLKLSHNRIKSALLSGLPLSGYIFSYHRVLKQ